MSYYYSTETREVVGETFFSYKVLPPSETYNATMSTINPMANMTSLGSNNSSYVLPVETVETFPVDNFTIYEDFMCENQYGEQEQAGSEGARYQAQSDYGDLISKLLSLPPPAIKGLSLEDPFPNYPQIKENFAKHSLFLFWGQCYFHLMPHNSYKR